MRVGENKCKEKVTFTLPLPATGHGYWVEPQMTSDKREEFTNDASVANNGHKLAAAR